MKPLHYDALALRPSLQRARTLLEKKDWAAANALLGDIGRSPQLDRSSPEYGEWCILMARVLTNAAEYREAVQLGREGLRLIEAAATDTLLAEAHRLLGTAYLGVGETKRARVHTRDALAVSRRLDDPPGMMAAYNDLAHIYFVRGEFDEAVDHLTDAIQIAERVGRDDRKTVFVGNLGRIRLLQGRWTEAETALQEAFSRAKDVQNDVSSARNALSLAYLAVLRSDYSRAASLLDEALVYIERAGLLREKAIHQEYSGWWHFGQAHWIQAKEAFRNSLAVGRKMGTAGDMISQSLRGLAECETALGDWSEAQRLAEDGLAVALEIDERIEVGCCYRILAHVQAERGDLEASRISLSRARDTLSAGGDPYELAKLSVVEGRVLPLLRESGTDDAIASLQTAVETFDRLGATDQRRTANALLVDVYRSAGRLSDALRVARGQIAENPNPGHDPEGLYELGDSLATACVEHSLSGANEYRLGGMPWVTNGDRQEADDELQAAVDACRKRLGATRVLLLEIVVDGQRSGRVIASSGSDDEFARHIGAFAANTYQHDLTADAPKFYWSVTHSSRLAAHLTDAAGVVPASVISIPVELGPGASGLLYADVVPNGSAPQATGFDPRDVDFAVAFGEVVAWRSTKLRSEKLLRDVHRLRDQLGKASEFPSIVTQDADFRETLARVRMVADADVSILLQGETGTGKDLLGRAIHYSSVRRDRRFVSVNCAALPETLLESELFGVKRGAFTGADRDKLGLFEEADGGTFFLDEIGEMPLSIQAKLLRLLETKELVRLGDTKPRKVDVRVISATNRDLAVEMESGGFRRDLYYRLAPVVFTLPPLRDRREDIPLLLDHFLETVARETGRTAILSPEAIRVMCAYHWPGNVREVENEVRKVVLLAEPGATIGVERLSRKFSEQAAAVHVKSDTPLPERFSLYDHVAEIERQFIVRALNEAGGIKKHAAARLGMPESTLRLKMKQYDIAPD